jgi:hypothetical protein
LQRNWYRCMIVNRWRRSTGEQGDASRQVDGVTRHTHSEVRT